MKYKKKIFLQLKGRFYEIFMCFQRRVFLSLEKSGNPEKPGKMIT